MGRAPVRARRRPRRTCACVRARAPDHVKRALLGWPPSCADHAPRFVFGIGSQFDEDFPIVRTSKGAGTRGRGGSAAGRTSARAPKRCR